MRIFGLALLLAFGAFTLSAARTPGGDRVYYEIFVRSFQDSGADGIGDLRGAISRLDYLKGLGIGGIWLTPIFKSPSYHGYDATDYRSIQPDFGSLADFDAFIAAAHARDIRVVLDLAINHTSSRHPWFSTRHDWYVWRDAVPSWPGPLHWFQQGQEFYYAYFGPQMPDLNLTHPDVVQEIQSMTSYWLARGVDGFRLDAARYYVEGPQGESDTPATHALIRELAAGFKKANPDMTLVGEVWSSLDTIAPYIADGSELDLAFDFPFSGGLLSSLNSGVASGLSNVLRQSAGKTPRLAPFLTNHDMNRISSQLSKHARSRDAESVGELLKLAAAVLLSQPGTPFIYYGEEIGMGNGHSGTRGDQDKRTPMQWERAGMRGFTAGGMPWAPFASADPAISVQDQLGRGDSLLETYRALIALRSKHPALHADGAIDVLADPSPGAAAYVRSEPGGERILVVCNFGATALDGLSLSVASGTTEILWGDVTVQRGGRAGLTISGLAPRSAVWIRL
jgi:glycosidase